MPNFSKAAEILFCDLKLPPLAFGFRFYLGSVVLALLGTIFILGGCGVRTTGQAGETRPGVKTGTPLRVLVAASAHQATKRSIATFKQIYKDAAGLEVELVAGPSNGLARQILAGAAADLFVSADPRWAESIAENCRSRSPLMSNQLVLALNVGSSLELKSLADLAKPSVGRIAIATESVPVGDYARQVIEKLSPQNRQAIRSKLVFAKDSSALLAWLENEVVDAAIIYRSDLLSSKAHLREAVAIESSQHDSIVYTIACLKSEQVKHEDFADKLCHWLRSKEGQVVFEEAGFGPAPK